MNRCIFDWPLVNESTRNKIKRIVSKIWTAAAPILYFLTRGTAVQRLSCFFFISQRFNFSATYIRDWLLAYSFICSTLIIPFLCWNMSQQYFRKRAQKRKKREGEREKERERERTQEIERRRRYKIFFQWASVLLYTVIEYLTTHSIGKFYCRQRLYFVF